MKIAVLTQRRGDALVNRRRNSGASLVNEKETRVANPQWPVGEETGIFSSPKRKIVAKGGLSECVKPNNIRRCTSGLFFLSRAPTRVRACTREPRIPWERILA